MTEPVTPTPISPLPPAPLITDTPEVFDDKAFPFAASLVTLQSQVNTQSLQTNQNAVAAKEGATAAVPAAAEAVAAAAAAVPAAAQAAADADWIARRDLGPHFTFPTTDNQGRPIIVGAHFLYTGVTPNAQYAWDGTQWLIGMNVTAGVTQLNGQSGALQLKTIGGISLLGAGNIDASAIYRSPRTSNVQLVASDKSKLIDITAGTFTQTFAAAATLGDGWWCYLRNSGTGVVTIDPNAAETIDGVSTKVLDPLQVVIVQCDGVALRTVALEGVGNHSVIVHTGNGRGSTNTVIRRFTTAMVNVGSAITYADSETLGATFTINEPGLYAIQARDVLVAGAAVGISRNSSQLTTAIGSINVADRLASMRAQANDTVMEVSVVARLAAGDVIRHHLDTFANNTTNNVYLSIRKVGL